MASLASPATAIPQFTGLKAGRGAQQQQPVRASAVPCSAPGRGIAVKASLRDVGAVAFAAGASLVLAGSALADTQVLLGGDDGTLAFVPSEFSVAEGETIVFKNNAGFPHNVVFDEDEIPAGVDAGKISMDETDLLNAAGETYSVKLPAKGTYSFYCSPHQGAGMVGKVTVN